MGSKLSLPGGSSTVQCPSMEEIHTAYKQRNLSRARDLLRGVCEESESSQEKGQLLSIAAAHGDLETVQFLLTEKRVELPTEPTDDNPAVVAAHFGHAEVVRELLESLPGPCTPQRLLNWMLALACQRGHLEVVKLLVLTHGADPENYAVRKNEFPVIVRLPLYAAIKAGNEDIAIFLLRHGAYFCSYILLDSPEPSKHLLRKYFIEASALPSSYPGKIALRVKWSHLKLPWVDLDWLLDISCQITELDLSANCLPSLPSIIPWGLINLKKLNLSNNQLGELPCVQSSDEIICSRLLEIDISFPQRPQSFSLFHKALNPWSVRPSLVELRSHLLLGKGCTWETPEGPGQAALPNSRDEWIPSRVMAGKPSARVPGLPLHSSPPTKGRRNPISGPRERACVYDLVK